jgi:CRISPR-associated protein Cmr4
MITDATILYLYTETPLHVGTGSGLSNIDLPIQRERTTQYPMIQGSSIKGKMRATAELILEEQEAKKKENKENQQTNESSPVAQQNTTNNILSRQDIELLFGSSRPNIEDANNTNVSNTSATSDADKKEHAGSLIFGDARLLLFPVRSLNGVFAYTTCYKIIDRFLRDVEKTSPDSLMVENSSNQSIKLEVPQEPKKDESGIPKALVTKGSIITQDGKLMLEEFAFTVSSEQQDMVTAIADWLATNALPQYQNNTYFQEKLRTSLVILPDNEFRDFALYATEVITRIAIERATKTVTGTALWTEENLPADTFLYVPVYATNARMPGRQEKGSEIIQKARGLNVVVKYFQLGGDETVGRGMVRPRWVEPTNKQIK